MEIKELFKKHSYSKWYEEPVTPYMDEEQFIEAIAEYESNRLEKLVSQPSEPSFGQWIDVNDKLPKIEGDYLIFDTYGYINMQLYSIEKKFLDDDCLFTDDSVTHWMLLPQNPLPKP